MRKNKESPGNFNKIVAVVSMEITHVQLYMNSHAKKVFYTENKSREEGKERHFEERDILPLKEYHFGQ